MTNYYRFVTDTGFLAVKEFVSIESNEQIAYDCPSFVL
jgi:hypothetical protein